MLLDAPIIGGRAPRAQRERSQSWFSGDLEWRTTAGTVLEAMSARLFVGVGPGRPRRR